MAKARTWTVREAAPEDDIALGQLFREVFGFDRGEAHHRWKFRSNPAGDPIIAVAQDGDRLVGQYALWPTVLRLGRERVLGAQSLDTMTHPDFRGQGMFTVVAEECMRYAAARGVEALYGFPNSNSQPGFVRRLDWDCTGEIGTWARPLRPSRHPRSPRWAGPLLDMAAACWPSGRAAGCELRLDWPDSDALDGLLQPQAARDGVCRVEHSAAYFAWRFAADAGLRYRPVAAWRAGSLVAFAVWGTQLRNGVAVLSELTACDAAAGQAVLSAAVAQAREAQCPLMLACSNRPDLRGTLARCGFVRYGGLPLIVRKLTARTLGANVHTHAAWELFGSDLDTF